MSTSQISEVSEILGTSDTAVETSIRNDSTDYLLYEFSDEDLQTAVENLKQESWQMKLENNCFEKYLNRVDPTALIGFEALLQSVRSAKSVNSVHSRASSVLTRKSFGDSQTNQLISTARRSSASKKSLADSIKGFSTNLSVLERGPRVNVSMKMEIVDKEIDDLGLVLQKLLVKFAVTKANLKAQTEEICIRMAETKESRVQFEKVVLTEGVDPLTKRIPAEKFIYFMEDWLKNVSSTTEKLRLKTDTMRSQYNRLRKQYAMKQELGESLRPVDFEQLAIENKDHLNTIEEKNNHLFGLKKVTGITNLTLSIQKKNLIAAVQNLKQIDQTIKDTRQLIIDMDKEEEVAEKEVESASEELGRLEDITSEYSAPPVIDYVKKKAELNKLEEQIKAWTRRRNIQRIALNSYS